MNALPRSVEPIRLPVRLVVVPADDAAAARLVAEFDRVQERWGLRESTRRIRRWLLGDLIAHVDPLTVTMGGVDGWLDGHDVTARTRRTYLSMVKQFFIWLQQTGARPDDPTVAIRAPRTTRMLPRPVDTDDLRIALEAAPPLMRAWLSLGAFEGLRCCEIAGLRREAVQDQRDPAVIVVEDGKGGKQRVIPLHDDTWAALVAYGLPESGSVFMLRPGKQVPAATVSRYVGAFFHELGMPWTAHNLRHWFGVSCYRDCHDLRVVQELMGHSSPTTTAGYTSWSSETATRVVTGLTNPMNADTGTGSS